MFNACENKPSEPVYDNSYDPLNEYADDIPPTIFLEVNTDSGITNEMEFIFDAGKSFENDLKEFDLFYKWDLRPWSNEDTSWTKDSKKTQIFQTGGGNHDIKLTVRGLKKLIADTVFSVFVNTRPIASACLFFIKPETIFSAERPIRYPPNPICRSVRGRIKIRSQPKG